MMYWGVTLALMVVLPLVVYLIMADVPLVHGTYCAVLFLGSTVFQLLGYFVFLGKSNDKPEETMSKYPKSSKLAHACIGLSAV